MLFLTDFLNSSCILEENDRYCRTKALHVRYNRIVTYQL